MPGMGGKQRGGGYNMPSVMDAMGDIVQILSQAKLLPDAPAYMQLLQGLESGVLQIIDAMRKQTAHQAAQGPPGGPQGGPGPGGPGGGPPGGMGGMGGGVGGPGGPDGPPGGQGAQIAPGGGAGMAGFGTPNPDELRRTLAGPAAVGGQS